MASTVSATTASDRLLELVGRLERQEGFAEVVASLQSGHAATLDGVWGSSCALAAAALASHAPDPLIVVCPQIDDIDEMVADLALFSRLTAERFSAWESLPSERVIHDEVFGERLRLLKLLQGSQPPKLVVTSIQSLLQPVPDRESLRRQTRSLRAGGQMAVEEFSKWLVGSGFHHTSAVELPGEFSVRGGIVDIFAPDWYDPVRVELFGDEIESIRRFEVSSQRSLAALDAVDVTILEPSLRDRAHLGDYLPPQSWFLLIEPDDLQQQGQHYLERLQQPQDFHNVSAAMQRVLRFPSVTASAFLCFPPVLWILLVMMLSQSAVRIAPFRSSPYRLPDFLGEHSRTE